MLNLRSIIKTICTKNPAKEASQLLHRAGLVGIHYNGMRDGECYVIFDDKDLKITRHERFMKTNDGVVYGYVDSKGNVHLDRSLMNGNTPIHEFGHLWNDWCKENNAELWGRGVELIKDSRYYEEVKRESQNKDSAYFGMNEAQIVDEAMARAIGDKGEELLKQHDITKFAEFKSWLAELWHDLKKKFGVGYNENLEDMTLDEFTEIANRDLLGGEKLNNDSMTDEQRTIVEQAKENGTYMKAPNGKPTKLTEKQWVQVRTKAFKEWFGDWEKAARIEKLRKAEPIKITGKEHEGKYELNRDSAKTWIKANIKGEYINKDTNEKIVVSNVGVKEVTSHGERNEAHLKSLIAIPELISNSIFVEEIPNTKEHDKYDSYRYYVCGLNIGGVDYTAKVVIGVKGDSKYYDHRLTEIEKGTLINNLNGLSNTVAENQNTPNSVGKDKRLLSILQVNSSKVVDKNGEPMVVYHGTDTNITTFDKEKTADTNFWFINRKDKIENGEVGAAANGKIIPVWLNARNLAGWKEYDKYGLDELRQMKYDGIDLSEDEERTFVIFEPTQIKSATDNIGTYDNNNPDIRYQEQKEDDNEFEKSKEDAADVSVFEEHGKAVAEKLGLDIEFVTSTNELEGKQAKAKGFYSKRTGKITIVVPNHANIADIEKTILHEAVAHHGLRELFGEEFDNMIESIFMQVDAATRLEIMRKSSKRGWDYVTATEEYLASMAEDTNFEHVKPSVWQRIKQFFGEMLSAVGLHRAEVTDNDLRYILWRSYENLKKGGKRGIFDVAEDVAMQYRLKVGNYAAQEADGSDGLDRLDESDLADEVNKAFNEQLETLTEDNADKVALNLGTPSAILRAAGVEDKPMKLYGSKLIKKAKLHGFSPKELQNLPAALADPIAVFDNYKKTDNRSILTELNTKDGNFLVSLTIGKGIDVDFNIIASAFGKANDSIVKWINKGFATYINKEKALNYLYLSAPIAEAAENSELSSAAKVVKDFENPKQSNDVLYHDNIVGHVNEKFNEALQRQINGTLAKGYVYNLGMPSSILLSANIPNLPIELVASRLSDKSMQENHPFDLNEVKDLPIAIQNPLAVFRSATHIGSNVILTNLKHGRRNYVVAIETNRKAGRIYVNSVRSVHYRNNMNIIGWINDNLADYMSNDFRNDWIEETKNELQSKPQYNSADVRKKLISAAKIIKDFENRKLNDDVIYPIVENGSLQWVDKEKALNYLHHSALRAEALSSSRLNSAAKIIKDFENRKLNDDVIYPIVENGSLQWVDKEKGLNWLSSVSHYAQQEIDNQALNSAAKIVENFENRKLNDDVIYRDNNSDENTDARSIHEQRVRRSMFQTQEALQDSMLGLKEAMESITKSEGKKIERVLSLETKGLFLFYHFYFTCISNV